MLFQTCKTFVHIQNTNEDIFNEILENFFLFCPFTDSQHNNQLDVRKGHKETQMNWAVQSASSEETRLLYMMNHNSFKNSQKPWSND